MRSILSLLILALTLGGASSAHMEARAEEGDSFWRGWTAPVNVSQSPLDDPRATWPTLGVSTDGQLIYLAWSDHREASQDIYYVISPDGGWNWGTAQTVDATEADSLRPSLVVSGTTPFVAWAESVSALTHTTHQWALDSGQIVQVPNESNWLASAPNLAVASGGELHMALQGGMGTKPDILYSRRAVGAATWPTATVVFTHTASGSHNPAIAVSADGQMVHLVWQENFSSDESAIYYLQGQWNGEILLWQSPITLSEGATRSVRPAIALQAGTETSTWNPVSGTLHVVWGEQTAGLEEQYVRYSRSDDGGAHWSASSRVSPDPVSANNVAPTDIAPALSVTPLGAVCVGWHGFQSSAVIEAEKIFLTCSTDKGEHWGTPLNISRSPETISIRPVLATGNDNILHVAWQELAGDNPVNEYQIYYAHSLPYSVMLPMVWR